MTEVVFGLFLPFIAGAVLVYCIDLFCHFIVELGNVPDNGKSNNES